MKKYTRFTIISILLLSFLIVKGTFASSEIIEARSLKASSMGFDKYTEDLSIKEYKSSFLDLKESTKFNSVGITNSNLYESKLNIHINKSYISSSDFVSINNTGKEASIGPTISISPTSLNFGTKEVGSLSTGVIQFFNNIGSSVEVSVVTNNPNVTVSPTTFLINTGTFLNINISMSVVSEGLNSAQITFNTSNPTYPHLYANVSVMGYFPAKASVSPNEFNLTLEHGQTATKEISITNSGTGILDYNISFDLNHSSPSPPAKVGGLFAGTPDQEKSTKNSKTLPFEQLKTASIEDSGSKIVTSVLNTYILSGINLPTGLVWVNGLLYILDYSTNRLMYYNPQTSTTNYIANIVSSPYGLTWDGTYLWIGNPSGTFYAYNLNGTFAGLSFQGPFNYWSSICYVNGEFYISALSNSTIYRVNYSGGVLWSTTLPGGVTGAQILYVSEHSGGNFWIQPDLGGTIYQINNAFTSVLKSVSNGLSGYVYGLTHNGINLFSASSNILNEIEDGISENAWLNGDDLYGSVQPGSSVNVSFDIDASKLGVGTYHGAVIVQSSDQLNSSISVPVNLTVTGQPQISVSPSSIDFGNSLINATASQIVTIENKGGDILNLSSFSSSLPQFTYSVASTTINPGGSTSLTINFQPTEVTNYSGLINFTTNDPNNLSYTLSAQGIGSPATVRFNITDGSTGNSILNAAVNFNGVNLAAGNYLVTGIAAGTYPYTVSVNGYAPVSGNINVDQFEEIVNIALNPVIIMSNGTITASCSSTFYDPGFTGNYANNQDMTLTIYPPSSSLKVKVQFQSFELEDSWDYLYIYDGENTGATLLGTFTSSTFPPNFIASNASGALTFRFTTDVSVVKPGWVANITCFDPTINPPLTFNVTDAISFAPIQDANIFIEGLGTGITDASGNYSYGIVNSGTYTYSIIKNGYLEGNGVINFPATSNASVTLNRWPNVEFTIKDQAGSPISNATVNLGLYNQLTDGSGIATFNQVVPLKNYSWTVTKTGYNPISGEQYVGNDNVNLSFQLQSAIVDLTLTVLESGSNNPLKDAVVVLNSNRYVSGSQGTLSINGIQKGSYSILVSRHAYYSYSGTLNVTSNLATITLNKIESVSLPYSESFNSAIPSNFSVYDVVTTGYEVVWSYNPTNYCGGVTGELKANWRTGISTVRQLLPPINTQGVNTVNLSFRHFFDDYGVGMKLLVETSTDGNNWTPAGWEKLSVNDSYYGPELINLTLSTNTNSPTTYIAFTVTGDLWYFDNWYVDNIQVSQSGGLFDASIIVYDDETSEVISGAQVSVNGYGSLLTNNDGIAYFSGVPNGTYGYSVSKSGYALKTGSITINDQNASQLVDLLPLKVYPLTIHVWDGAINLQGAMVTITGLPAGISDNDGNVNWSNVPTGSYNYTITKEGFIDYSGNVNVIDETFINCQLNQKYFKASFHVVDASSNPVQNALIIVDGIGGVVTNEFGNADVQGLESDNYSFTIQKSGFSNYTNSFTISGSNNSLNITLSAAPPALYSVLFHVTELNGTPIVNASVILSGYGSINTNVNGEVLFTNIPVGTDLTYSITKGNYFDSDGMIGLINENKVLTVVMKPIVIQKYQLTFHVTDAANAALPGATVDLVGYTSNVTNGSGNVTFSNISFSDQIAYQVTLAGYKTVNSSVTVHDNISTTVTMSLLATTTYSVTFNIGNSSGSPIKDAIVYLTGYGSLITNSSGAAVFSQVNPKNGITYTVSKPPYADLTGSLDVVAANVVQNLFVNTNIYRALFTVLDQFNNPYEGVNVSVLGVGSAVTNYNGTSIIGGLAPGTFSYMISTANSSSLNGSFTISSADLPIQVVYTKPVYPVTFTVKDESGVAITGATVELTGYGQNTTNTSGQVLYTQVLPKSNIPFEVTKVGYVLSEGLVSVENAAVEKNVTLILKRHSIQFSVFVGNEPITDAVVTFNGVTNQAGYYLFTEVLPGTGYNYSVSRSGYKPVTGTVSVSDFTSVSVNLEVETFPVTFTVSIPTKKSSQLAIPAKILIGGRTDTLTISTDWQATQNLPRGFYNYKVWATGYQTYYGSFEIVGSAVSVSVRLGIPTGLDNISLSLINAFPNPFSDQITFNNTSKVKQIIVSNLIGQRILIRDYTNESIIHLETNEFVSGVYLIKLIGNDGTHNVLRMVKK